MKCAIFDLDGTLADNVPRLHLIQCDEPDWDEYYRRVFDDAPIAGAVATAKALSLDMPIVIVTGRRESTRHDTARWLERHGVPFGLLFMRSETDFRPNAVIKEVIVDEMLVVGWKPAVAFDDHPEAVKMFRAKGITTFAAEWVEWPNKDKRFRE